MAKMIVSAVSNLAAPSDMPTQKPSFSVQPTENMMEGSKDKAPVLLRIPYVETTDGKAFAREIAADSEIGVEEAALYLNVFGELVAKLAKDASNFYFGIGRAELSISGSLAAGDEQASVAHQLQYTVIPTDEVKRTFAAIECRIPTDEVPASIRRIRDQETGDGFIMGKRKFYIQGNGMTCSAAGEKLELCNADDKTTVVATATVLDASSEVSILAKLPTAVEPGRYFLKLTTLAGGDKTLYPVGLAVTVVEKPEPAPRFAKVHSTVLNTDNQWKCFKDTLEVEMENDIASDATASIQLKTTAGDLVHKLEINGDYNKFVVTGEKTFALTLKMNTSEEADGTWLNTEDYYCELIFESADGTVTMPIEVIA